MKKTLILLLTIFSFNIYAENINTKELDNDSFNEITNLLCKNISINQIEDHKKMACLKILIKGVEKDNINSMNILYSALSSKVNFKQDYNLKPLKDKISKLK